VPATKKKTTKKRASKKVLTKFKNRGGTKFTLTLNGRNLHDIILEECNLGGSQKITGETKPRDLLDTYRAVIFFMWGIPLDTPIDKEALVDFKRALKRLKKEDPTLFEDDKKK